MQCKKRRSVWTGDDAQFTGLYCGGLQGEKRYGAAKQSGEKRGKLETARAMLKELPIDQVARFTGLSREELQSLAGEIAPQG